jgi:hypothetical protein
MSLLELAKAYAPQISANREKSSKLAFNRKKISSPVDLECEIAAKCVLFTQRSRESGKLKTRWRMSQSAANRSPRRIP